MLTREQLLDAISELIEYAENPNTEPQSRVRAERIIDFLRNEIDAETMDVPSFWYTCVNLIHLLEPPNSE